MANKPGKYLTPHDPVSPHGATPSRENEPTQAAVSTRRTGKKSVGRKKRRTLLIVFALVFCAALIGLDVYMFHLYKARSDFQKLSEIVRENTPETEEPAQTAPSEPPDAADVPAETEPTEPEMLDQYAPLYAQNRDLFGWLKIDGTVIDYPVMHTPYDPERYLHTNFEGNYSFGGVPFIDASCTAGSDNLLIYGHNMLDGSMFRSLLKYQEKTYWQAHPTICFDTLYEKGEYEILAAFYDRVYYTYEDCFKFYQFIDAEDAADFDNAISNFKEKALYDTGVTASYGDRLITLVTCAYHVEDGRFVVAARKK